MPPVFLALAEAVAIHADQIRRYGGEPGIRDLGLLQSAVAMPQASVGDQYLHRNVFEMAAAHLFHIMRDHPFVDGNKRTGAVAAVVFLRINDIQLEAEEGGLERLVRGVAKGKADKEEIAEFFRRIAHYTRVVSMRRAYAARRTHRLARLGAAW